MAGSKRKRLPQQSNSSPQRSIRLFGQMIPVSQSQAPPTSPSPANTPATSRDAVGDQPIPAVSAKYLVPAASAVRGQQGTDSPPQSPAPRRNAPVRPRRNGTALDPNAVGVTEHGLSWESNLWFPGVRIPGRSKKGLQIFLGNHLTKQEAQDVHDRAALKLFQTKGVAPRLNFHESRHTEFMEEYRDWNLRDFLWQLRRSSARFSSGKSSMKGVSVKEKPGKGTLFEAKTAHTPSKGGAKVFYYLGKFASEEEAGRAYDRALLFLHREETEEQKLSTVITNFRPSKYSESEILRAGKAINMYKDSNPSQIA